MCICGYMVGELCEYCGNKFDKRGMGRHRASCRKRKQREQEAAGDHNGKAVQDAKIQELLEKIKLLERTLNDLTSQVVELIKDVE